MPSFIVQSAAQGFGGDWIGPTLQQAYSANLQGGNALVGFTGARSAMYPCTSFSIAGITDSQTNSWTNLSVDNSSGYAIYGLGYSLTSSAGPDTLTFTGSGFCSGLPLNAFDPGTIALEVAGVTGLTTRVVTSGDGTPASGSVMTASGLYTFTTLTSYPNWFLNLLYFAGPGNNGIVLASIFTGQGSFAIDSITDWSYVTSNLHNGIYTQTVMPTPGAPVRVFVNSGASRPLSSFQ